ncbi:restriction endonuclease subunit S [Citricoccus sp. I39-566]|uniref:restriction endonuclease subunit S n=1 Tax=Citricoccus sp. I39-566 TaxID=3073268 RepID=UPI00286C8E1C|nr:restriction endonuclease subunit S [Citricoccus sp. I39-566]WMY79412.1 restriction endonuclease subunit S [Citricoccus sp. I39-566]
MIATKLRQSVLQAAIQGHLTRQDPNHGTAAELLEKVTGLLAQRTGARKSNRQKPLPAIREGETPFELPENWEWVRLGEIAKYVQRGKSPKYADSSNYLAISQKCIQWSGFDPERARAYAPESFEALTPERRLFAGDLLWNSTGTGTVGRALVLTNEDVDQQVPMAADSHVTVIRCHEGIDSRYLLAYIASPQIQRNIESLTSGTTKQKELNLSTIVNLPVPLAPTAEQDHILRKLDEVMPMIDRLAELERERASI